MSVLLVAAALAATASIVATGCVAYVLISFWRSGHLMASRVGHQSLSIVVVPSNSRRQYQQKMPPARARGRVRPAFVH